MNTNATLAFPEPKGWLFLFYFTKPYLRAKKKSRILEIAHERRDGFKPILDWNDNNFREKKTCQPINKGQALKIKQWIIILGLKMLKEPTSSVRIHISYIMSFNIISKSNSISHHIPTHHIVTSNKIISYYIK